MNININLINGAHHEWKVIVYFMQNVFPEMNIQTKEPWNCLTASSLSLYISANLDNKIIKGYKNYDMNFKLDETIDTPCIFYTGEPFDVHVESETGKHKYIIISSLKSYHQDNLFHIPFAVFWYTHFHLLDYLHKYRGKTTDYDYIIGYCATRKTKDRTEFMEKLVNKIHDKSGIICLGRDDDYKCSKKKLPNYPAPNTPIIGEYSKCKFIMCFENCEKQGYLTEKIICAFVSGAIPIYWGDHDYAKSLFNPEAFICVRDFQDYDACIHYILNMNDSEINVMRNEPMFKNDVIPPVFDVTNFSDGSFYGDFKTSIRKMVLD